MAHKFTVLAINLKNPDDVNMWTQDGWRSVYDIKARALIMQTGAACKVRDDTSNSSLNKNYQIALVQVEEV